MPVWGWVLLIAGLSALAVAAVGLIVPGTHELRDHEPLHGDSADIAAPVPLDVATADELTVREREADRSRDSSAAR